MAAALRAAAAVALALGACATRAEAEERLAVLEFFGRPSGAYCSAAGPAMRELQLTMAGRAVLLEYDYDRFGTGRVDRFWAAEPTARYLPLVMVGSGLATSSGQADYERAYQQLLETELARPPAAEVEVYQRRVANALRFYVRAVNRGATSWTPSSAVAMWAIAWENARVGVSSTWVRAAVTRPVTTTVPPGGAVTWTADTASLTGVEWEHLAALALVEWRPGGVGRWDMLQARMARPVELTLSPDELVLERGGEGATVAVAGPAALGWSASTDVAWLRVVPSAGTLPGTLAVELGEGLPPGPLSGWVRLVASGDGLEIEARVRVTVPGPPTGVRRRLHGVPFP